MNHKGVDFLILARPGRDQWTVVISYGLAFADALDLGSVEGIELPAALALLLRADLRLLRTRLGRSATPMIKAIAISNIGKSR